jgi:hypothetical protein
MEQVDSSCNTSDFHAEGAPFVFVLYFYYVGQEIKAWICTRTSEAVNILALGCVNDRSIFNGTFLTFGWFQVEIITLLPILNNYIL